MPLTTRTSSRLLGPVHRSVVDVMVGLPEHMRWRGWVRHALGDLAGCVASSSVVEHAVHEGRWMYRFLEGNGPTVREIVAHLLNERVLLPVVVPGESHAHYRVAPCDELDLWHTRLALEVL